MTNVDSRVPAPRLLARVELLVGGGAIVTAAVVYGLLRGVAAATGLAAAPWQSRRREAR